MMILEGQDDVNKKSVYKYPSLSNESVDQMTSLVIDCFRNALSSVQSPIFLWRASAAKGISSGCVTKEIASCSDSLNNSSGTNVIFPRKNAASCMRSLGVMPERAQIFSSCVNISAIKSSGAYSNNDDEHNSDLLFFDLIIAEIKILVSTTSSMSYQPFALYLFQRDRLISLPNSRASFSVNLLFAAMASNNSICDAFSRNACRAISDQFISGCLSIISFNS